jgi:large subunit ribosomal protein L6
MMVFLFVFMFGFLWKQKPKHFVKKGYQSKSHFETSILNKKYSSAPFVNKKQKDFHNQGKTRLHRVFVLSVFGLTPLQRAYKRAGHKKNKTKTFMEAKYICYLEIVGIGYKASIPFKQKEEGLILKLGLSHDVMIKIPPSIRVFCLKPTIICCISTNRLHVTQFGSLLRSIKPPEPYKGKGIKYHHEMVKKKQGNKK